MHSLTASACSLLPHNSFADLNSLHFPSVLLVFYSRGRSRVMQQFAALSLVKETGSLLGCSDSFKKGNCYKGLYMGYSGFLRRCKDWDCDGDFSLEAEILEFMKNSNNNPEAFPTKKELIDSGRMDLVDAIIKKGGWLAFGWDLYEDAEEESGEVHVKDEDLLFKNECDAKHESSKIESEEIRGSGLVFPSANYSQPAVLPGRSVEIAEHSGIEGILNRLEKERNSVLGLGFRHRDNVSSGDSEDNDKSCQGYAINSVAADLDKSIKPTLVSSNNSSLGGFPSKHGQNSRSLTLNHDLRNSLKPDMWRSWVLQRNGSSLENFEDAEIAPSGNGQGVGADVSVNDILEIEQFAATPINREEDSSPPGGKTDYKEIKSRIWQLESELSSVLRSLRSGMDEVGKQTGQKTSDDLQKLSDAWEFQENEILKAKDRLRSIHAKLAVLEGKMKLAITEANKIIEEKQKKIDNACGALRFLKSTCVVWPNGASEVFLVGSFDGWSSQRKMEKSNSGVFSVSLQLYPGKYEIKFIVDGEWKIDPLRPIVNNNGHDNNLLIIQE